GVINALEVFDDGSGTALYAGGDFTAAGDFLANHIARWDGNTWAAVSSGNGMNGIVYALLSFDDGIVGPALYAGGNFTAAGGTSANGVARWDGSAWSPLGGGTDGAAIALRAFDD